MSNPIFGKRQFAFRVLFILIIHACPAFSGDLQPGRLSMLHPAGKVRLQIRISEAKKKKDALRYYRSVARQQKAGRINPPSGFSPREAR